jgi:hypothetical protein
MLVVKLVLICLLVVLVGSCARYLVRETRANSVFDSAKLGQSEASVVQQLGPPDEVLKCGEYLWWNGDQGWLRLLGQKVLRDKWTCLSG